MSNSSMKGTALITGASTGIGAVYADRLAKRGYNLILVARNEARLKSLSARLTSDTGRSVKVLRRTSTTRRNSPKSKPRCGPIRASPCSSTMPASARSRRCWKLTLARWTT